MLNEEKIELKQMSLDTLFKLFLKSDGHEKKELITLIYNQDNTGEFKEVVIEALRSNCSDLFLHVMKSSNYPAQFFTQGEFNQMVLKCAFLDFDVLLIKDLEKRKNTALDTMLQDYQEEQQLAGRKVPSAIISYFSLGESYENV